MKHLRLFKDREEFNAADLEYPTLSLIQEDNSTVIDEIPPTIIARYVFDEDIPEGTPCFYSGGSFTSFEVNGEELVVNNPIINLGSITPTASSLDPLSFSEDSFIPAETTYAEIKFSKPVTYLGIYIEPDLILGVMPISAIQQELPQLIAVYSDDSIRFNCAILQELVGLGQVRMVLYSADSETPESIEEINSYTPIINSYSGGISLDANLRSWPAGEYTVKMEFNRKNGTLMGLFYSNPHLREIYCKGNFSNGINSSDFCQGAYNLQSVSIVSKNFIEEVGNHAFSGCTSLTAITIPESLTSIGESAFRYCSSLTSITIPEGVTSIGDYAFKSCRSLTSITIPENSQLTSIGYQTFYDCSSLKRITLPEGLTNIGEYAFSGCSSLTAITFPEGVTRIEYGTFRDCSNLKRITLPEELTSIGKYAFEGCSSLTTINIPEGVTGIGDYAFKSCRSLTAITCDAVTPPVVGLNSFYNIDKTIPVYVPASSIDAYKAANYWKEFTNFQAIS